MAGPGPGGPIGGGGPFLGGSSFGPTFQKTGMLELNKMQDSMDEQEQKGSRRKMHQSYH